MAHKFRASLSFRFDRMKFTFSVFSLFVLLINVATAAPLSFADGESFQFRVSWGIFRKAGVLKVTASREDRDGADFLRIVSTTSTAGLIRQLYTFDGRSECLFDHRDGRLLTALATAKAGTRQTNAFASFDYEKKVVRYEDRVEKENSADLPLPPGEPMDMITTLLNARAWNLKVGESVPAVVMFDDNFYELTITAEGSEHITTPLGEFDTLILTPHMDKNPRGMFKRGGTLHVWITQDARRLPVKLQIKMGFGSGNAYLTEYHPGTTASVAKPDNHP